MPFSKNKPFYIGVDGCRAGWFAILLTGDRQWRAEVFPNIVALWKSHNKATLILIDIPIGLKEGGAFERRCDKEARKLLGPDRGRGVFRAPCRQACYAVTYAVAKAINKQLTGKGLPVQTWSIIPKIREVDELFEIHQASKGIIREIHPEVCFCGFNGEPMRHNKKRAEGFKERLQILKPYHPDTAAIVSYALSNYRRKDVAKDDILDALAAAVTAFTGVQNLVSIPQPPEFDDRGLPMQMLYRPRSADLRSLD